MIKVDDFGQKSQEIASVIVKSINQAGLETTILSLAEDKYNKKRLRELKRIIREKKEIEVTMDHVIGSSRFPKYRIVIDCAGGTVEVFPILKENNLEFNSYKIVEPKEVSKDSSE